MSTSGTKLFDDDLACDVRDSYRRLLEEQVPDGEATRRTIAAWDGLDDREEPVFWLALAATQSGLGRLEPDVLARALEVIDSGRELASWEDLGPGPVAERSAVLAGLRAQLTGPQPRRKVVRRRWRYEPDLEPGAVLAWTASTGDVLLLRVLQIQDDGFGTRTPILQRLVWEGSEDPPAEALADLDALPETARLVFGLGGRSISGARETIYAAYQHKKRDPGWAEAGFRLCGTSPARPGDDADYSLGTPHLDWQGLPYFLERSVTGLPPRG